MDLERRAIERLKMASEMSLHYYGQPLICTYSGGKDSDVMLTFFKRSGIPFEVHNSHTTVDAPQTVYHIRKKFKQLEEKGIKCTITMPLYKGKGITMWNLIPLKLMPPTRTVRYCCSILKETACKNRMIATGVRWDESNQRSTRGKLEVIGKSKKEAIVLRNKENDGQMSMFGNEIILMNDNDTKRQIIERCELKAKMVCNPIIDWTHKDIWEYIHSEKIEYNPLYDCGYKRVGCIGCPMAAKRRYKEFAEFPAYKRAYIRAFDRMLERLIVEKPNVIRTWQTGQDVFEWWMEDANIKGQYELDFDSEVEV